MAAATSISSFSTSTIQELILNNAIHSRKLLFHNPLLSSPPPSSDSSSQLQPRSSSTFDANVVMVLSVLLCALICSLGLNSIIRCALRCSTFAATDSSGSGPSPSAHIANTGIKKKALKTFPTISYTADLKLPGLDAECAICLSDFAPGERVRVLPKCHHGFHIRCIDKWLSSHSSCPTCRNCLIETCNKIVGSTSSSARAVAVTPSPQPQEVVIIRIEPLQPECMIRNHDI